MSEDKIGEEIVYYCTNCHSLKDCWCDKHAYLEMWEFVYRAMKAVKPN